MVLRGRKDNKQWVRGQHQPLEEPEAEPHDEARDDGEVEEELNINLLLGRKWVENYKSRNFGTQEPMTLFIFMLTPF